MLRLILARIPQAIAVVLGVTVVAFILVNVLPGNITYVILGDNYTKASAALITKELGLNHPIIVRYLDWLGNAVQGKFGSSLISHEPVSESMRSDALPTIELVLGGQLVATFLGVIIAVSSVASRKAWVDRLGTGFGLFATSMPPFVLALLLVAIFAQHWHLISPLGWSPPSAGWGKNLSDIAVPCFLLGLGVFPGHMRIFRSELYEQLENEEYVTLARMKGMGTRRLMVRHVAKNAGFGLITVLAVSTGALIAGAVILENIFGIPGIGSLILQGVQDRDAPVVEGCLAVVAVLIVLFNLLADIAYMLVDPRVRDAAGSQR